MTAIILLLFLLIHIISDAYSDAYQFKYKQVNHESKALQYVTVCAMVTLLSYTGFSYYSMFELLQLALCLLTFRWIVFDIFYNIFTGKPIFFVGSTSFLDTVFKPVILFWCKFLLLFFSVLLYSQFIYRYWL